MSSRALPESQTDRSGRWLIIIGVLWLILAGGMIIYQITHPATVRVEWETATELRTIGFKLLRSQSLDGEFEPISHELIPSQGSPVSGAKYTFVDKDVAPGETYFYVLEEVESDASSTRYTEDMFSYTVPNASWLIIFFSAASALAGIALLGLGIKEHML